MDSNIFDNLTQGTPFTDLSLDALSSDDPSHTFTEDSSMFSNLSLPSSETPDSHLDSLHSTYSGVSKNAEVPTVFSTQHEITFAGGLWPTQPILEVQMKGDCGAQMLEKMAQLHHGDARGVYNSPQSHLADVIQEYAKEHNPNIIQQLFLGEQPWGVLESPDPYTHLSAFAIDPAKYTSILHILGVETHWSDFSHSILIEELNAHRPVGVILDAQYLTNYDYPAKYSPHAITLTGMYYDIYGQIMYYGIDTNFEQVCTWSAYDIERAIEASVLINPGSAFYGKVLLSDQPIQSWPYPMP